MGDTYHNRYSSNSPYKGNKKHKKLPKKCRKCGSTSNLDIHHPSGDRKDLKSRTGLQVLCRSCHRKLHAAQNGGKGASIISTASRFIKDPKTLESKAIASAHENSDIMYVEFILCHADENQNNDEFKADDLLASAHTAINKPINWEHRDKNIGTIFESEYIGVANLTDDQKDYFKDIDPLNKDFVVCRAAIWEYKHPFEARVMRDRQADGKLYFSMENKFAIAKCSVCEEEYDKPFDYCDHLLTRHKTGLANRIFKKSNFIGAAVVKTPADSLAGTLALASKETYGTVFSDLAISNAMKSIAFEDVAQYFGDGTMEIRKLEIPKDYLSDLSDLPDESFADEKNRVFPVDDGENIEASAKVILNEELDFYDKSEKLYILERLASAAKEYDIDIKDFINKEEPIGGNIEMPNIDINSPEFKEAVASALDQKLSEIESGAELKELEAQAKMDKKTIEEEKEKAKKAKEDQEAKAKELEDFKASIARKELQSVRVSELAEAGFKFDKNADLIAGVVGNMSEESYASLKSVLEEVQEVAIASVPEAVLETTKEGDPVTESNEPAIASKVDGDESDKLDILDECLKETLELE